MSGIRSKTDGDVFQNKYGNEFLITGYCSKTNRYNCITLNMYSEITCSVASINNKTLRHPLDKTVCGVGYLGVGKYRTQTQDKKRDKAYASWTGIIDRCYNENNPNYKSYGAKGVVVCEDWQNFQVFAEWFYNQENCTDKDYDIDKDLMGGISYNPLNCLMLHNKINRFISMYFLKRKSVCVYYQGDGKKRANPWRVSINGKHRGSYLTKEAAEVDCKFIRKNLGLTFIEENKALMNGQVYNELIKKVENHGTYI